MSEENNVKTENLTENASEEITEKTQEEILEEKKKAKENKIEILVAVFLGVTALLTAWASWIGSLHGGNQATNYTTSNNLASEGNSEYNAGMQLYLSDMLAWNTIMEYSFDQELAVARGDEVEAELIEQKIDNYLDQNGSEILIDAASKMTEEMSSPFEVEGMIDSYFANANALLAESQELLEQGKKDNSSGDAFNLVNVIYSVVLFILGIVGVFKRLPNRFVVLIIAVVCLVIATVYMCTLPMPTGFDFSSYFGG